MSSLPQAQRLDPSTSTLKQNPSDPEFFNDPYTTYEMLHTKLPTFFWQDYGHWCFAAHADVTRLLRDKRLGRQILHVASREEAGLPEPSPRSMNFDRIDSLSMLQLEPPRHTRLRRLVSRAFVATNVERLRPWIVELANRLIDEFENKPSVDLLTSYAAPIPVAVIAKLLGVPGEMTKQLLEWSHRMVAMYQFNRNQIIEADADLAASDFESYISSLILEKKKRPADDLLSHMCSIKDEMLSDGEVVSTTILLLNAGHEATVHQTGNAIKAISESCAESKKTYQDYFATPQTTVATIEEAMRFDPPLHMFNRYALCDLDLRCSRTNRIVRLKKGDEIGLLLGAANHDPNVFESPSIFSPSRIQNNHLAFGGGIHFCLGAPLARLEMQITLETLFKRLPKLRLPNSLAYRDAYHFHGLEGLYAEPNP